MKPLVWGIDPGPTHHGWCVVDGRNSIVESGINTTDEMIALIDRDEWSLDGVAIEYIESFGMPVGRTTFDTCVMTGRFIESFRRRNHHTHLIGRRDVKLHLCNSMRAKDKNIRQAIIDMYESTGGGKIGQFGTKAKPGPLYGVKSHAMSALAVALTFRDTILKFKT